MPKDQNKTLPALIMLVGIPASGKSTLTARYASLGAKILSSDAIRAELSDKAEAKMDEKERRRINTAVFDKIAREAREALTAGQDTVIDATNLSQKRRMGFLGNVSAVPCYKKCVLLVTSPEECFRRNHDRHGFARVPDEALHAMLTRFECPVKGEDWDEIETAADAVPYRFPAEELKDFSQDNPHHTLTLDGHMRKAWEHLAEQGAPEQLLRVALCHDNGKLYTKRFRNSRGEPTETAHYYGHECYGAYLYLAERLCGRDLSEREREQVIYEACLIGAHMRPLNVWDRSAHAKARDEAVFGAAFMKDLALLHEADRAAH